MNAMKKILVCALALAVLVCAAGCIFAPTIDAAYVAEKMLEATANSPIAKSSTACTISMSMAMGSGDFSMDFEMEMDMAIETITSQKPLAYYASTTMSTELMGTAIEETTNVYIVEENGEYVVYTYSGTDGTWEREVADQEMLDKSKGMDYSFLTEKAAEDLILKEETETIGDRTVYVLTITVTGDEINSIVSDFDMGELLDSGIDLSTLTIPVEFYVDTETFLPIRTVTRIEGMSELLAGAMAESFGDEMGDMTADVTISDLITNYTYDGVEVPALPEEARPSV